MNEKENNRHQNDTAEECQADQATIAPLISDLSKKDGEVRERAREALVSAGKLAVAPLIEALESPTEQVRWEVAKALGQIGDPMAAQAFVRALEDEDFDVRWLAAEGLIALGHNAFAPLFRALIERSDSLWLRRGAHHVLHDLHGKQPEEILGPLLAALEDIEPVVEVPLAAQRALDILAEIED